MSHSQFHCTGRVYLDLHGLIFETSICYWQDQPGSPLSPGGHGAAPAGAGRGGPETGPAGRALGAGPVRPSVRPSVRRPRHACPLGWVSFFFAGALPPFPGRRGPGRGSGRGNTVGVVRTGSRVRETPCSPEAPTRGLGGAVGGVGAVRVDDCPPPPRGTPRRGSVVGRLGQTGRLGLAACGSARPGGGKTQPGLAGGEANPRAGGTVRPNAGAGPAGGGPPMAGHVCQSVGAVGLASVQRTAVGEGGRRPRRPARARPGAGLGGRGLPRARLRRSAFPETGFLKSCGDFWREPGKNPFAPRKGKRPFS